MPYIYLISLMHNLCSQVTTELYVLKIKIKKKRSENKCRVDTKCFENQMLAYASASTMQ